MKFASSGTLLTQFGTGGTGIGQVYGPQSIALDGVGNIFVVDSGNWRVEKFDADGNYLSQFGTQGSGKGQFQYPAGVVFNNAGNIYVTDNYGAAIRAGDGNRVEEFGPGGNYLGQIATSQFIDGHGIAMDASGFFYVTDASQGDVCKFSPTGSLVAKIGTPGFNSGQLQEPEGVAVDAGGNIYVTDDVRNCVNKYGPSGVFLTQIGTSSELAADGELSRPLGVALDKSGNVYVADYGDRRIEVFSPTF